MDEIEQERIDRELHERMMKIMTAAGFSPTDKGMPPIEKIWMSLSDQAQDIVDLYIWRLEQKDVVGRRITSEELIGFQRALDALWAAAERTASIRASEEYGSGPAWSGERGQG